MTVQSGRRPKKTRGRKRDEERTAAILRAAGDLLLEVGFDRLRIQDVATRAGCGTGAIYRRWPKKESLLAEAIRAMPAAVADVTADPVADLRALVARECHSKVEKPDLVPGLISAMRADPDIEDAVKTGYSIEHLRGTLARIVGPDHPHLDLLSELAPALSLFRTIFPPGEPDPDAMTDEIMAFIRSIAARGPSNAP